MRRVRRRIRVAEVVAREARPRASGGSERARVKLVEVEAKGEEGEVLVRGVLCDAPEEGGEPPAVFGAGE